MFRALPAAGAVAATVVLAAGVTACGTRQPAAATSPAPAGATSDTPSFQGITTQVGGVVDVINARIPAPPAGSAQTQVEVTLADANPGESAVLLAARSPAARAIVFTSHGRVISHITIPVSAGTSLTVGPPNPGRILLTGLRRKLTPGGLVTISLVFAHAGQATLRVPVTPAVP